MELAHQRSWSLALASVAALSLGASPAAFAGAGATSANAGDFAAIERIEHLAAVGHGTRRGFGLPIYVATPWSGDGSYRAGPSQPLALTLAYRHPFSRSPLIDITASEWPRLGLAEGPTRARWAASLGKIWPDVEAGDELSVLVTPAAATRFHRANRLLGRIEAPACGPAYLPIWLDGRSRLGRLCAPLRGPASGVGP